MKIYKNQLTTEELEISESLLFNGNGHIGIRNTLEEFDYQHFTSNRHTYINGFYDTYKITYPEQYFGASTTGEQMLPVIDGSLSEVWIGDTQVNVTDFQITDHERYLDLTKGVSGRSYLFTDTKGNQTRINYKRITSFTTKELLVTNYQFEKLNHDLAIEVKTHIQFTPSQNVDKNDPRVAHNSFNLSIVDNHLEHRQVLFEAPNSKVQAYFSWDMTNIANVAANEQGIIVTSRVDSEFTKAYTYSLTDYVEPNLDFDCLVQAQEEYLNNFWTRAKVTIKADDDIESSINYGTYALLQSVGEKSIAAKGLSGIGYEGHVFWDAEMYVFPVFNKIMPSIAREMLMFRIKMLDKAIANRKLVGYPNGALYPWRTITGLESSSFFEAGMAQHHINVDISYALSKYIEQSGDITILDAGGFKMMVEIGRMFASIMSKDQTGYHLDMVTGPDEYSALVSDNFYTNCLVKKHFENIVKYQQLVTPKLQLTTEELTLFKEIAQKTVLPFDNELMIAKQDRDFLRKAKWPYQITGDKPLLLKHHPLEIYRYQISKQADVVLAMQLVGQELYNQQVIANTVKYYDTVTTHDSSLSFSNFATVYARLQNELAYEYFLKNARLDLDNLHHNTKDGIHTASMGGSYQTIIDGFSNYRIENNQIVVDNLLPREIQYLKYCVEYKGEVYQIELKQGLQPKITKNGEIMKYKGILFDLDGVICDTAGLHYLAWKRLANELGGDIDEEFNETLKGVDRTESLKRILAHINVELDETKFSQMMTMKNDWYVESLDTLSETDILPGMDNFLNELVENGIKIAIASASRNAPNILEKIGVMQYVDTIADPAAVKQNKPAPDIFLLAAEQLGLNKDECLGIEDSQAGIIALNSAAIDSLAIGDALTDATIQVSSTEQVNLALINE